MKGKVYFIGAGPGNKDLLTIKAAKIISRSDVVIYDKYVSSEIVDLSPSSSIKILVEKDNDDLQKEINNYIIEKTNEKKDIVRLKQGDPFVFDSSEDEFSFLIENNIEFEIVPGLSTITSILSYNGIPITHKGYSSSIHVYSDEFSVNDIDYNIISKLNGTLVFLVGIRTLFSVVENLLNHGIDKNTDVLAIENGTKHNQKKVVSNLDKIREKLMENEIYEPVILVVGSICSIDYKNIS